MTTYQTILAVDSAMNGCGAALYYADTSTSPIAETLPMARGQAEALVPMAQRVVAEAGKTFAAIDLVCTTIGPGTFTGLRVGMSAARSFALAMDVPLVGVSTLDVLAAAYCDGADGAAMAADACLCVLIETKREDFYAGFYECNGAALSQPAAMIGADICAHIVQNYKGRVVFIGDAPARFFEEQAAHTQPLWQHIQGYTQPDPVMLARIGLERALRDGVDGGEVAPLYLRGADVSQPKLAPRTLAAQ